MSAREMLKPVLRKKIIRVLDAHLGRNYFLFVFGSFARKTADRSSDIDLAVWRRERIRPAAVAQIREDLEAVATLRDIDFVNLTETGIKSRLLENILKEGVLWKRAGNPEELLKNLKKRLRNTAKS